jgi:pimeloyl-ACP methyl ester carboxylesterase
MSWTESTIGGTTAVRVWEAGAGTPLLYLHGFEAHPGEAPFVARLAESRRVIAPEHPGYGETGGAEETGDILAMVLHYRQLIEQAGLGPVDIVGHSLGGMFAAELAAICPQVVRRLVLVSPYGLWLDEAELPDPFRLGEDALAALTWAAPARRVKPATNGTGGPSMIDAALARATNLSMATRFLWPIPDRGLDRRIGLIRAPSLVLAGEQDRLVPPAYAHAFAARIPGARTQLIPDAGHYPMSEQPEAFLQAVSAFLG